MKSITQFTMWLLLVLAFAACKTYTKDADGKENLDVSESGASDIITYTNSVIDVLKTYNDAAKNSLDEYNKLSDLVTGNSYTIFNGSRLAFLWTEKDKAQKAFGTPTSALGSNKQFFTDSLKKYKSLFDTFSGQDSVINLYIKGKDYLDDKGEKGKALVEKQFAIYDQLAPLHDAIVGKIEQVADAAEEIAMKNNPMRDAYSAAKSDLRKSKSLLQLIGDTEKFTDAGIANIESEYNALWASIEQHKKIDRSALDKGGRTESYNRFYKYFTDEITELKVVIRNLKQSKKLTESDYSSVNSIYNSIISDYNSWVN